MFDRPPREREWLSWLWVALWALLIFLTIPFARDIIDLVKETSGLEVISYGVVLLTLLIGTAAIVFVVRRPGATPLNLLILAGIAGIFIFLTFRLGQRNPAEALHYVEYGVLSLLLYRAFTHRFSDCGIYLAAILVGTIVGVLDESIQWLTPRRVFGFSDVWLNVTALALTQAAIAAGIRPKLIAGWPGSASLRRLCRVGILTVALMALCCLNTPERIAWYAEKLPLLAFIAEDGSVMVEYGYLHQDPETGTFRSRLTKEEILHLARERAVTGARILDQYRERHQYQEFLDAYDPIGDPFLHEARVHLFRRDIYVKRGDKAEDEETRREKHTVAYWENRILEKYYAPLLQASSYVWPPELKARIEASAAQNAVYESAVSEHLITALRPRQILWGFVAVLAGLVLLERLFAKRAKQEASKNETG